MASDCKPIHTNPLPNVCSPPPGKAKIISLDDRPKMSRTVHFLYDVQTAHVGIIFVAVPLYLGPYSVYVGYATLIPLHPRGQLH